MSPNKLISRKELNDLKMSFIQKIVDEITSDPKAPIKVSPKLNQPDILITNTEEYYKKSKNDIFYRDDKFFKLSISVADKNKKKHSD